MSIEKLKSMGEVWQQNLEQHLKVREQIAEARKETEHAFLLSLCDRASNETESNILKLQGAIEGNNFAIKQCEPVTEVVEAETVTE